MCTPTKRFRQVEVQITSVSQPVISLKENSVLNEAARIVAIEAYKVTDASIVTKSKRPVVNTPVFLKSTLTLKTKEGDEVITEIPLTDLHRPSNNGILFRLDIPPINVTECYISIAESTGVVNTESFLLGFHYEK